MSKMDSWAGMNRFDSRMISSEAYADKRGPYLTSLTGSAPRTLALDKSTSNLFRHRVQRVGTDWTCAISTR